MGMRLPRAKSTEQLTAGHVTTHDAGVVEVVKNLGDAHRQEPDPTEAELPLGHGVQALSPAKEYWLAGHFLHWPFCLNDPASHESSAYAVVMNSEKKRTRPVQKDSEDFIA